MVKVMGLNEPRARVRMCSMDVNEEEGWRWVEGCAWVEEGSWEEGWRWVEGWEDNATGSAAPPVVVGFRANMGAFRLPPTAVVAVVAVVAAVVAVTAAAAVVDASMGVVVTKATKAVVGVGVVDIPPPPQPPHPLPLLLPLPLPLPLLAWAEWKDCRSSKGCPYTLAKSRGDWGRFDWDV